MRNQRSAVRLLAPPSLFAPLEGLVVLSLMTVPVPLGMMTWYSPSAVVFSLIVGYALATVVFLNAIVGVIGFGVHLLFTVAAAAATLIYALAVPGQTHTSNAAFFVYGVLLLAAAGVGLVPTLISRSRHVDREEREVEPIIEDRRAA